MFMAQFLWYNEYKSLLSVKSLNFFRKLMKRKNQVNSQMFISIVIFIIKIWAYSLVHLVTSL